MGTYLGRLQEKGRSLSEGAGAISTGLMNMLRQYYRNEGIKQLQSILAGGGGGTPQNLLQKTLSIENPVSRQAALELAGQLMPHMKPMFQPAGSTMIDPMTNKVIREPTFAPTKEGKDVRVPFWIKGEDGTWTPMSHWVPGTKVKTFENSMRMHYGKDVRFAKPEGAQTEFGKAYSEYVARMKEEGKTPLTREKFRKTLWLKEKSPKDYESLKATERSRWVKSFGAERNMMGEFIRLTPERRKARFRSWLNVYSKEINRGDQNQADLDNAMWQIVSGLMLDLDMRTVDRIKKMLSEGATAKQVVDRLGQEYNKETGEDLWNVYGG